MSRRPSLKGVAAVSLLLLAACARAEPWRHDVGRDHALVGRIWDVRGERFVSEAMLVARLATADFVMLGEKHDNADHHRLQARLVDALAAAGRRPAVAFEMLTEAERPALERYLEEHPGDARGLGEAVDWQSSGWPDWSLYEPIAQAALDRGLALAAAGLSRDAVRHLGRQGTEALDADTVGRLALDAPLDEATRAAMAEELRIAHCDRLPEDMLPMMVRVQRARDAVMADNLVRAAEGGDGGVLIAGNGHARNDRGVPAVIARLRPGARLLSLAIEEADADLLEPAAYAESYGVERLPFDYVWFTPRVDDDDPCDKFDKK